MLRFEVHKFRLGQRFYILLPKLNNAQVLAIARRLEGKGYAVQRTSSLAAKKDTSVVHIDPAGLCWSASDPSDAILPAIPEILRIPRQLVPLEELGSHYFLVRRVGRSMAARMSTRVESSTLWRTLRADGLCGLAPDERAVALFLIAASTGCELLTDFPTSSAKVRMVGKKQYYTSFVSPAEAASTLRAAGQRTGRSSYLPEYGVLRFHSFKVPQRRAFIELFESLGEWCSFRAV